MANSNLFDTNPVYVDVPNPETHVLIDSRPLVEGWQADRFHRASEAATVADIAAEDSEADTAGDIAAKYPDTWAANPDTIRETVRFEVSASGLESGLPLILEYLTACGACNVDSGYSVYAGKIEDRITVSLFDLSLRSAFGYFAELRSDLRAAGIAVDCGRFYVDTAGESLSLCARRTAPYWYTLAAGIPLAGYVERTLAYAAGPTSKVAS